MATTVLIVDDHAAFRASAKRLLESEGFEIVGEAVSGGAAVEQAASSRRISCCSTSISRTSTASRSPTG